MRLASAHHLFVVEDAAQAHGAKYKDQNIGTMGNVGCFSFYPGKNLGAYGDAGALVTDDDDIAKTARMMANHGRSEKYNHEFEGVNSRLDGLQGAVLDVKLKHLEKWTERRIAIANQYDEALKGLLITPKVLENVRHVYHLYVVRIKEREKVRAYLSERGISTGIHYPIPLPLLNAYAYLNHDPAEFPCAYAFKDEILSLPMHGALEDGQVDFIVESLRDAVASC